METSRQSPLLLLGLTSLAVCVQLVGGDLARFYREQKKSCAPGCETNGNCNTDFGTCMCRFGYGGDDCSKPLLSACQSAHRKGAVPQYGVQFPKNCHCYRQLLNISCHGEYGQYVKDVFHCNQDSIWNWEQIKCYEYRDLPPEQQISDPPEAGSSRVEWKKGVRTDATGNATFDFQPYAGNDGLQTPRGEKLLPLSNCTDRCNERGRCVARGSEVGACVCAPFYLGAACAQADSSHCPLACSGRGTCDGGFCHCQPGWWGAACTRSKSYTADDWTPHPTELRIFVYDLPESVAYLRPLGDDWPIHHSIYLAEIELLHRLLNDTEARTENPWEANLFYIPAHSYYYIGNVGFPGKHYTAVFRHVRENYPWWNLTAGRNHVAASSNDRGCCDLYRMGADVQHPIKVVHFAQAPRHGVPLSRAKDKTEWGEQPEALAARLGSTVEDPAMVGAMAELQHLGSRPRFKGFPPYELPALQQEREQCYRPEHDVAFPPYLSNVEGTWSTVMPMAYNYSADGRAAFRRDVERRLLFHFSGYTKKDMAYSAGVRQGLLALFANNTRADLSINNPTGGGTRSMLSSRFCFTPMGFGWGIRLSQAMLSGCVPVMVHDHVWPTLWDVLPYEKFSVRISRHNLYRLLDYLEAITPAQLARLQDGLAEWHKAFVWQPEFGGLAYNYTLQSLHRKVLNMWTAFF